MLSLSVLFPRRSARAIREVSGTAWRGAVTALALLLMPLAAEGAEKAGAGQEKLVQTIPPVQAPALDLQTQTGEPLPWESLEGRALVINFWATWCAPCLREMPALNRLQALYKPETLTVLAVSTDRGGAYQVGKFLKKREEGWDRVTIALDPKMQAMQALEVRNLPTTVIITPKGLEIARLTGTAEWDDPDFLAFLQEKTGLPQPDAE